MSGRTEIKQIQTTIKGLMAARNLTLKDLSKRFEVSIATAKRLLNQDDLSLERVLQFCDWIGIRFKELLEMANAQRSGYHYCTMKQEEFLAKNLSHFAFLRALQKGDCPKAISRIHKLSKADVMHYLNDLEFNGFIRMQDNQHIELIVTDGMDWRVDGPIRATFMGRWVAETASFFSNTETTFIDISQRKFSTMSYKQFLSELDEISRKYAAISRLEREIKGEDELKFHTCMIIAAPLVAPMWQIKPYRK